MRLGELIEDIPGLVTRGPVDLEVEILGLTHDYARVEPGMIYTCLCDEEYAEAHLRAGPKAHIGDALRRGATCILHADAALDTSIPSLLSRGPNRHAAVMAARLYGHPLEDMMTVGITGTNGKTSISFLLASIAAASGRVPGVAGTLGFWAPGFRASNSVYTTPLAAELYRNGAIMRRRGVDTFLLESTSHGLALERECEVRYDAAVFTNLSRDHIDFHGAMDRYIETKLGLFRRLRADVRGARSVRPIAVINADDPLAPRFEAAARGARVLRCSAQRPADYRGRVIEEDVFGSRIEVSIADGPRVELRIGLPGRFNVDNALLSFAVAHGLGLPIEAIVRGLAEPLPVPGRFEVIDAGQPFTVVVDYAHTPAALRRAIDSARSLAAGRVLVVFGAGGDRDREKRPEMGNVAATGSDRVFVTSDNPRWEGPEAIVAEIMEGIPPELRARVQVHVDRQRAIHQALDQAEPGDLVLICGKGHETVQIIQGRSIPFDDRVVVGDYVRPRAAVPPGDRSRLGSSHG